MITCYNITQQGQSHIEHQIPCQDYSAVRRVFLKHSKVEIVIAAIADGVGSCTYSQFGSMVAVESAIRCLSEQMENLDETLQNQNTLFTNENILNALKISFQYALECVEKDADEKELPFIEFDSTLTMAIYNSEYFWYGHIGDDGIVVLYEDGTYEMITRRHEDAQFMMPLREIGMWEFGCTPKPAASFALMTDGVLDHCVDSDAMQNRVYFPFLKPALTTIMKTEEQVTAEKEDWEIYLAGSDAYPVNFRTEVSDDISFVIVQNPEKVEKLPKIVFDHAKWEEDTRRRKKEIEDSLYADYRAYRDEQKKRKNASKASREVASEAEGISSSLQDTDDHLEVIKNNNSAEQQNSIPVNSMSSPKSAAPSQTSRNFTPAERSFSPQPPQSAGRQQSVQNSQPSIGQQILENVVNAAESFFQRAAQTSRSLRNTLEQSHAEDGNKNSINQQNNPSMMDFNSNNPFPQKTIPVNRTSNSIDIRITVDKKDNNNGSI